MNTTDKNLSIYLASSIHEIKNAFARYQAMNEALLNSVPEKFKQPILQQKISFESQQMSNQLSQVLITYKNNQHGFLATSDDVIMEDYIAEIQGRHEIILSTLNANIITHCETDLVAYLDERLVTNAIDTLIYNSIQAGATQLLLTAKSVENFTLISLEDNGPGFPEALLEEKTDIIKTDNTEHNTGLGLYFASNISQMHQLNNQHGYTELNKSSQLNGAAVNLYFPL